MKKYILLVFVLFLFVACKSEDSKFPEVKNLSEFEGTEFLPTLEHKISSDKNAIYCATLPIAWQEVKKSFSSDIKVENQFTDLKFLDKSERHLGVLKDNEYETSTEIGENFIKISANLSKSLPFETKLLNYDGLFFYGKKVQSFGVAGYNSNEKHQAKILYYRNDNNFIVKLIPKDREHEILLFKSEEKFESMTAMLAKFENLKKKGVNDSHNKKTSWKYWLGDEDEIIIPKLSFNIKTNFATLENAIFTTMNKEMGFDEVSQRVAFVLNENGAEIESEVEIAVVEEVDENKPKPKKMIFDKSFFVMLKRTESKNPYFCLWNTNSELMLKN